jgi:predicted nucleic acid-binding protein
MVILDTNIIIKLYRGNHAVREEIIGFKTDAFYVSSITAAEFLVGAKNTEDLKKIEIQLSKYILIPINTEVSEIFLNFFRKFILSHRPAIADTLIAATALYYHLLLYTLNKKDFRFIPGIHLF